MDGWMHRWMREGNRLSNARVENVRALLDATTDNTSHTAALHCR